MLMNIPAEGMDKREGDYQLVILDISLGDEDSFPLLETLKKENPDLPVIMFSGYDSGENIAYTGHGLQKLDIVFELVGSAE